MLTAEINLSLLSHMPRAALGAGGANAQPIHRTASQIESTRTTPADRKIFNDVMKAVGCASPVLLFSWHRKIVFSSVPFFFLTRHAARMRRNFRSTTAIETSAQRSRCAASNETETGRWPSGGERGGRKSLRREIPKVAVNQFNNRLSLQVAVDVTSSS